MKITILSKPEEMKSGKGTTYWKVKISDQDLEEKSGSYFGNIAPEIDKEYEVEEKYNEQYKSFSWFAKREKKAGGFVLKPGLNIDQQIRSIALQEAVKHSGPEIKSADIVKVAQFFETYIRDGKI